MKIQNFALLFTIFVSSYSRTIMSIHALSQSIVVVGLNAALQKRFVLSPGTNLEAGNVYRAYRLDTGVGGKGQDVGVALSCLNPHPLNERVILAQFLGKGPEGDGVSHTLMSRFGLSDDSLTIRNDAPLRTCTTIVGAESATELVEMSGAVTPEEMRALTGKIDELVYQGGKADCVCIMGSMPPGCEGDTYADLTMRLVGQRSLVLIDTVIGLEPLLSTLKSIFNNDISSTNGRRRVGGAVLKLNAAELCKLVGVPKSETSRVTIGELSMSTQGFVTKYANAIGTLDYLCITDGRFPGYVVEVPKSAKPLGSGVQMWQLPAVDLSDRGMLYPIGAGDTVAGGTLAAMQYLCRGGGERGVISSDIGGFLSEKMVAWWGGDTPLEDDEGFNIVTAFAFGLACGSASCLKEDNSVFDVKDVVSFFDNMAKPVVQSISAMS